MTREYDRLAAPPPAPCTRRSCSWATRAPSSAPTRRGRWHARGADAPLSSGVRLGVGGWTSAQGLAQLRRDVIPLHPKVITVYFGWNDHWRAMGLDGPGNRAGRTGCGCSRGTCGSRSSGCASRRASPRAIARAESRPGAGLRGEPERAVQRSRARPGSDGLVTAPANHVPVTSRRTWRSARPIPRRRVAAAHPGHRRRRARPRGVAAPACADAAAAFTALPGPHDRYFHADGIHLTEAGDVEMARVLSGCLAQAALTNCRRLRT